MGCAISIEKVDETPKKKPPGGGGGKGGGGKSKPVSQNGHSGSDGGQKVEAINTPKPAPEASDSITKGGRRPGDSVESSLGESTQGVPAKGAREPQVSVSSAGKAITEEQLQAIVGFDSLRKFSCKELQKATKKFSTKLGEGGFGSVFKGRIPLMDSETGKASDDGQQVSVAIKVLDADSHQGAHEWITELEHLANLKHKHVVRLLGYCQEQDDWMLVYEFMPYGSFDYHIFAPERPPVPFIDRLKVSLHAAKGLHFLHENNVIYRDFKTSNILVDTEFNAKLADFGLARAGPGDQGTHVSTGVKGTMSYMAPEYISTGHLTPKCDVFAFGVVLLETLSGRQASATKDAFDHPVPRLIDFANKVGHDKARQLEMLDPMLRDQTVPRGEPIKPGPGVPIKAFKIVLQAALFCIDRQAQARPEMKTLVESLSVAHAICVRTADMKAKELKAKESA